MTIHKITPKQPESMNFPTITIPDPAAVGKWLDEQQPGKGGAHSVSYSDEWSVCHWYGGSDYIYARAATPEALLAEIRRKLAENDPLAKLRKEAEAAGYALMKFPTD
jgi:hypothetical protein